MSSCVCTDRTSIDACCCYKHCQTNRGNVDPIAMRRGLCAAVTIVPLFVLTFL
mgnify:CR=1 FL=1